MRSTFFIKNAWNNIKKNYRFFIPRIICEAGLLAVFYIVFTLKQDERILSLKGGDYIAIFMNIGTVIVIILSVILMLYVNGFLMKQRKHEFGLYNVLGMNKRHISRILFFENSISGLFSVASGILLGMLFYKACSLLICKLLKTSVVFGFYFIKADIIALSALLFVAIDLVIYLFNCLIIARLKPIELIKSSAVGEREPKIKWVLLILGIIALGAGYFISLTTKTPLKAMLLFFIAVLLVILGTYFLFTAGSTFILKMLKRNGKFYYNKKHMPAVSGLLYRMKQNAVGLASICILSTCLLVMISTTVSLYVGMEDTLISNYPQHWYVSTGYSVPADNNEFEQHSFSFEDAEDLVTKACLKYGVTVKAFERQQYLGVAYTLKNGVLSVGKSNGVDTSENMDEITMVIFITQAQYSDATGEELYLNENECALYNFDSKKPIRESTLFVAGKGLNIKTTLSYFPIKARMYSTVKCYAIVVADNSVLNEIYLEQKSVYGDGASEYSNVLAVTFDDLENACEYGEQLDIEVLNKMCEIIGSDEVFINGTDSYWDAKESIYGMYASFLFLGLLLGTVFLFATALIIYYKQISEGYEDRSRFQIMKKIGMSEAEVKKTINSQVLIVFFLPLVTAGIHLIFAFPILEKLLHIMLLSNTSMFILCTVGVFTVFALVYVLIYSLTARTYYKIVR